jgi:membrane-associated phospholipid phosphatase
MTRPAPAAPAEWPVLEAPRRTAALAVVSATLTAALFVMAATHAGLSSLQRIDDSWLRLMIEARSAPLTAVAKVFNVLGLVYVTLPVRIAVAGYLALRRRWWHFAAFVLAIVLSEALIGPVKAAYDRPRPHGSLVATTAASFPSGHATAASVTVLAAVITLVPPHRHRTWWGVAAVAFALLMALSRAYLGAHWLSDAIAGLLLGTSCALVAAVAADRGQRAWKRRRASSGPEPAVAAARPAERP